MTRTQQIGDMHFAVVAVQELGGEANPEEVAERLRWYTGHPRITYGRSLDVGRARTALLAAHDHGFLDDPR